MSQYFEVLTASKRSIWHFLTIAAIIMLGIVACTGSSVSNPTPYNHPDELELTPTIFTCPNCDLHSLSFVIDGDTLDLTDSTRVRIYGIDTPERGKQCYAEATERLRQLASNGVRLEEGPRARDSYGRRLAYAYTADGTSIDALMISEGLAEAWTRDGQHRNKLVTLEKSARKNRTGCLWVSQP